MTRPIVFVLFTSAVVVVGFAIYVLRNPESAARFFRRNAEQQGRRVKPYTVRNMKIGAWAWIGCAAVFLVVGVVQLVLGLTQ